MTNQITTWKNREGRIKESVWLSQGIKLYRELLNNHPDHLEYKTNLAKLLTRSGTDEKIKYVNLMDARHLFEEVLEIFPKDAEALYRLGHISFESREYDKSITYFSKALEQSLSDIRAFRASSTISKAYFYLGDEENAMSFFQKAKEMDRERNFTSEIKELESLITQKGYYKRFARYSDGALQLLSLEDAERLKDETVEVKNAVLDMGHYHPTFTGPEGFAELERKEAEILRYLIEREKRHVHKEELLNVWEDEDKPKLKTIETYISYIRKELSNCIPANSGPIIETKRGQGYRWVCETPTEIIGVF